MERHSIFDSGAAAPAPGLATSKAGESPESGPSSRKVLFPGEDGGRSLNQMAERDLDATLQLLAERAQYITGATGAAIALRDGEDIVCRASAGPSAPEVGAHLAVDSGLSGESIRTKQILRCDDAATDPRVNKESCEALGIASVVVMPLIREDAVNGVFELLSDRTSAFEERDIAALERLGEMVQTALDHVAAAQRATELEGKAEEPARPEEKPGAPNRPHQETVAAAIRKIEAADLFEPVAAGPPEPKLAVSHAVRVPLTEMPTASPPEEGDEPLFALMDKGAQGPSESSTQLAGRGQSPAAPAVTTTTVSLLKKCAACGFPVSEGRTLCLDCEKKGKAPAQVVQKSATFAAEEPSAPLFTMGGQGEEEGSWFSRHRALAAVLIVVAVIVVVLAVLR